MIIGYNEAREISGKFYEFQYETIVIKTEASKDFICFKDNDKESFTFTNNVFCWDEKCFNHLVNNWQGMAERVLGIYSYRPIGQVASHGYTAEQVVDLIYTRSNFRFLAHLITYGSFDVIM